ncbi:UDP-N-acetylmuramoyl-tripeptide--D-alanyl-D-alanine ligase [Synechococcus sp. BIOS-U3-1]|uniref:UDP-N-acetylmuramoyl-tripeptide--D-alanyl-D- alanine ligase n=1 Tax=Synechococcus sp. BIOS-U3-1 TaxID=1400865 RepID=UPI001646D29C|nr:UDP-N-acetylmuramoyl-tripeptide--D-alanyl-D-alanine ligase [Synechococcus sp. BIOS-U3-1]QNI58773.1 UDP-N-acetylmuramoyl-tripeptide--D-alanyl-D-alanine ligase [Synechococcus sp. BIOS-U3-1]|tara:strand:- start:1970 stop:3370 length:1401 start_codon:yes stop_codon:yes gene_type:complete
MTLQLAHLVQLWGHPEMGATTPNDLQVDLQLELGPVCSDSRQLQPGAFFIPLRGERFDGHTFLDQAAELGAQAAVVDQDWNHPLPDGLLHWRVENTLWAYQQLATLHRRQLKAGIVAVTGSAGKTTTRELIRVALAPLGEIQATVSNNNNDIGVPLTLMGAHQGHAAVVLEMGMRGLGEIERLSRCVEPEIAVITNIGTAHIGRLGSRAAIATAKCEITAALAPQGVVVIPAGDPLLEAALSRCWSGRTLRVALEDDIASDLPESDCPAADLVGIHDAQQGLLSLEGLRFSCPLDGRHNARNLMLALAVASELGVPLVDLQDLKVTVPGGRNRRLSIGTLTLLDETYNASPEAVLAALDLLAQQSGRRFAVLGTMLELGISSIELHEAVVARAIQLGLDGLVAVASGEEAAAMQRAASSLERFALVESPELAAETLNRWLQPGDTLLLKASRGVALERLIPLLKQP